MHKESVGPLVEKIMKGFKGFKIATAELQDRALCKCMSHMPLEPFYLYVLLSSPSLVKAVATGEVPCLPCCLRKPPLFSQVLKIP